jgi:hypothetical protein
MVWDGLGWDGMGWDRFVGYGFGWVGTGWDVIRFYNTITHRDFTFPDIFF